MFPIIGEVVIRTNGGELLVNAPADTVNHYGATDIVSIKSVSNHSYYEYGQTTLVDITNGRIVLTDSSKASVETIFLSATGDIYDDIIIATQNGANLPEVVARDEVSAPSSGTKTVVTIQNNVDQNGENPSKVEVINLYPAEDVQEKDNGYNVSDLGILVVEAISSEGITRAEQQITNAEILEEVKISKTNDKNDLKQRATGFLIYDLEDLQEFINGDYKLGRLQNTLFNIGSITINRSLVLDGNGNKIMGKSCFTSNVNDPSVVVEYKNIVFSEIHNENVVDLETLEHYGWEYKKGNLTAIYANDGFAGSLYVNNCEFDNMDWEAIQFTNTIDGSNLKVENCVFKHTASGWFQNRYIHLENNGKVNVTIRNNDFYNCNDQSVPQAAIACWDPAVGSQFTFESNYFDEPDWYVIRMGGSYDAGALITDSIVSKPNK